VFSPVEVVEALAERIAMLEPTVNAFTTLCMDEALAQAHEAQRLYLNGAAEKPLLGIPVAVKDLFDTRGVRTTYGSAIFANHVPRRDAACVRAVREAGGIILGKTLTHEFGWGITAENVHFGPSRNPWASDHISGGSSGGSAAALAARTTPLAIGSDTGGSIRIPAAFCGIIGLKPTYGAVSLEGAWPLAPSLDHAGPMARDPADLTLLWEAMTSPRNRFASDAPAAASVKTTAGSGLYNLRVGFCSNSGSVELTPPVTGAMERAKNTFQSLGSTLIEVPFALSDDFTQVFNPIQRAEALQVHCRADLFPKRRADYGEDVRDRLQLANLVSFSSYLDASSYRQNVLARFSELFSSIDVLLTPVSPVLPPLIGEAHLVQHLGTTRDLRDLIMNFTTPQNLAGLPACAFRAGFDDAALPIGLQVTGPHGSDRRILAVVQEFHDATPKLQTQWPEVATATMKGAG
jgi:aspartyl-tRNA(Asn)/glutamyl-tRNA(Gln) amidotransferase subunit A